MRRRDFRLRYAEDHYAAVDNRPLRLVTTQRAQPANAAKRLNICRIRDGRIERGTLDVEAIFLTGDQVFRIGACAGGRRNFVAYVKIGAKEADAANDIIPRGGQWQ